MIGFEGADNKVYNFSDMLTADQLTEFRRIFGESQGKNKAYYAVPNPEAGEGAFFASITDPTQFTGRLFINTSSEYRDTSSKIINWLMENSSLLNVHKKDLVAERAVDAAPFD